MYWNWKVGGLALGLCFFTAVALVKPIGVSTQFVILDGILASAVNSELVTEDATAKSGYASTNPYLNKSGGKYAGAIANPMNYGFVFVLSMLLGGILGGLLQRRKSASAEEPNAWLTSEDYAHAGSRRYVYAFIGGFIVLFGARLAGGCTSGHMMSGMMQTAISGYVFAAAAFALAVPTALILYRK